MKKILITGATGFAGSFLAEHLSTQQNLDLFGTYLTDTSIANISGIQDKITLKKVDLSNENEVAQLIGDIQPDEIYHLAALPSPAESFENPAKFIHNNVDVQLHILEALRQHKNTTTKVLIVSSAEIYGKAISLPIAEDAELRPMSPYSVSKATQDLLGLQYFLSYGMPIIRVRPFNHIGPRQSPNFVVASFAQQIVQTEKSTAESSIKVGNLVAKRDFTDVRDMVRAYQIVMDHGTVGDVYNIGQGKSYAMQEIVDHLISLAQKEITTEVDPTRLRPSDIPDIVCDTNKISSLGWKPEIELEKTLKDTLEYWRAQI